MMQIFGTNRLPAAIAALCIILLSGCAEKEQIDITGTWSINIDKSIDKSISAGILPADKADMLKDSLARRLDRSKITVTPDSILFMDNETLYEVLSATNDEVVIKIEISGQSVTLTFSDYDGESIFIRSSATNDMDNLIWDRVS